VSVSSKTFFPSLRPVKEVNSYERVEIKRRPTEALGVRVLRDEKCTLSYHLGDLYQYVLRGVNLRRRLVFQDKYVGVSDSREECSNRCVEVCLSQDHLFEITSTATCGMMYAHLGGYTQCTQRHLSIWVYLWMAMRQDQSTFKRRN